MRKKIYLGAHREKIDLGVFRICSCPNPPPPPYPLSAGVASTSARGVAPAQEVAKSSPSAEGQASTPVGVRHLGWSGSYQSSSGSPSSSAEVPTGGKKDKKKGNQGLGLTWESF